jgi:1-aminocyclopropane-1-carboxylate deaminase/D-cysteine desulfhydrase-like pyridoxal-dependent ACC family enzyme
LELYIRGEEVVNPTINQVKELGAKIKWIDRQQYRLRNQPEFIQKIKDNHPNAFIIPEGGTNALALKGLKEMMEELFVAFPDQGIDIVVAYGSGGTAIGMMQALRKVDQLHIVPVLHFPNFREEIKASAERISVPLNHFQSHDQYHFGGYAKFTPELIQFIHFFYRKYNIPLDPIYTGKVAYATMDLIQNEILGKSKPVVMIHSGGLQGIRGFNERFGMTLKDH